MMVAARRNARTVFQAKYAITPAPRRAMKGTHPWMLTTAECAATDTARKIVSAVVAPMPTRNPARHDRQILYRPAGSCGRAYRRIDVQPRALPETGRRAA